MEDNISIIKILLVICIITYPLFITTKRQYSNDLKGAQKPYSSHLGDEHVSCPSDFKDEHRTLSKLVEDEHVPCPSDFKDEHRTLSKHVEDEHLPCPRDFKGEHRTFLKQLKEEQRPFPSDFKSKQRTFFITLTEKHTPCPSDFKGKEMISTEEHTLCPSDFKGKQRTFSTPLSEKHTLCLSDFKEERQCVCSTNLEDDAVHEMCFLPHDQKIIKLESLKGGKENAERNKKGEKIPSLSTVIISVFVGHFFLRKMNEILLHLKKGMKIMALVENEPLERILVEKINMKTYREKKHYKDFHLIPWVTKGTRYLTNTLTNKVNVYPVFNQELPRLGTYRSLPYDLMPLSLSFIVLANAGFYYTNQDNFIKCQGCGIRISIKDIISDPCEPRYHGQACVFIKADGGNSNSLPALENSQGLGHANQRGNNSIGTSEIETDSAPIPQQVTTCNGHFNDLSSTSSGAAVSSSAEPALNQQDQENAKSKEPIYPQYFSYQMRLDSFSTCVVALVHRPDEFASAGMFYAGYSDCVRCYNCGLGMKTWRQGDEIDQVHERYRPDCEILKIRLEKKAEGQTQLDVADASTSLLSLNPAKKLTQALLERENQMLKETVTCKLCQKNPVKDMFLPCGDLHACSECSEKLTHCPSCQKKIIATVTVYLI